MSAGKSIRLKNTPLTGTTFPSVKESFCRPAARRIVFWPRCLHSDTLSPSVFFSKSQRKSPMESVFHRETLFSADRRPGQVFSSRPMSPLRYIVALEIFSKSCHGNPIGDFRRNTFKAPGEEGPQVIFRPIADPAKFFRAARCLHSDTLSP